MSLSFAMNGEGLDEPMSGDASHNIDSKIDNSEMTDVNVVSGGKSYDDIAIDREFQQFIGSTIGSGRRVRELE